MDIIMIGWMMIIMIIGSGVAIKMAIKRKYGEKILWPVYSSMFLLWLISYMGNGSGIIWFILGACICGFSIYRNNHEKKSDMSDEEIAEAKKPYGPPY